MSDVGTRIADIRERIDRALERAGRRGESVTVMAVTKTHPIDAVRSAVAAGISVIGENRVQEASEKIGAGPRDFSLHLVGHLQRNKAKTAAALFDCVQSIDKAATADALAKRCSDAGRTMEVFIEYNTTGEDAKSGVTSQAALFELVGRVCSIGALDLRGLMTIGPLTEDRKRVRAAFRSLAALARQTEDEFPDAGSLELSMGMSGDFEIAVEEGATMVRLGTALFGAREKR